MTPTTSVLLAVYNGAQSLERCFTSLAAQTSQEFVIVCVDDASTDATPALLAQWKERFGGQLQVLRNAKNLGLTQSLNAGLAAITTRYTARIDADDWWHPEKLARQLTFMQEYPECGVVGTNYINVGRAGERKVLMAETDGQIRSTIIKRNPFAHSCVVFSTALIQSLGGYDETVRYGQDYDLWLRCFPKTQFHNLQEFLCYRSIGQGISVEKQQQQMAQSVRTQLKYIRLYRLPVWNYFYVAEPFLISRLPRWLTGLKRKALG